MDLSQRLMESADWLDARSNLHERLQHISKDLRDAIDEIAALKAGRNEYSRQLDNYAKTNVELLRQLEDLREKLLIAETAAKDEASFRKRDQQTAQHITLGMTIAIEAMVTGLKKGGA